MWGSAVGRLPIFRVADLMLREEKADGERGVCSCTSGSVFYCNTVTHIPLHLDVGAELSRDSVFTHSRVW